MKGIALETVDGTGTRGRIMMGDVERTQGRIALKKEADEEIGELFGKTIPMTHLRKVIAKRMAESAFTAPHIYFFADVEMDQLSRLREEVVTDFGNQFGVRISINDFLIKAVALTIR